MDNWLEIPITSMRSHWQGTTLIHKQQLKGMLWSNFTNRPKWNSLRFSQFTGNTIFSQLTQVWQAINTFIFTSFKIYSLLIWSSLWCKSLLTLTFSTWLASTLTEFSFPLQAVTYLDGLKIYKSFFLIA